MRLKCKEKHNALCIEVSDSGIGIDPAQFQEIFEEFHQIKIPGMDKEGFGLGLAIVKRLADLLDHQVDVESTPGKGSTFSVCVPLSLSPQTTNSDVNSGQSDKRPANVSGMIILIEDDVQVADAWGLLLEAEGFQIATAASAKEANAVARHLSHAPDLIISDFHLLDGSTGVEAVQAIRDYFSMNIPAFIVSGDTSKVVQEARALDNSSIMNKPVDTDHLLQIAVATIESGVIPQD